MLNKRNDIIFVLWKDQPGGIEVSLPGIVNKLKFNFFVFALRPNADNKSVFENCTINVQYGSNNNFVLYFRLLLFALKHRSKIFHVFNIGPMILLILRIARIERVIYSIHGTIYWRKDFEKLIRKAIWKIALKKQFVFLANSEWSKRRFLEQISTKPSIEVVYNPFNLSRFNYLVKTSNYPKRIMYSGRLAKGKNLFKWLRCAKKIKEIQDDCKFNIYGSGPLKQQLEEYAVKLEIKDKITFWGFKKEINRAYQSNDLLIFLSEYESFGNVVVESILCGTPVIVSDIPSMREIFKNYPDFLVQLDENLEDAVLNKVKIYMHLKQLTKKAAKEFRERFSQENHFTRLREIYLDDNQ